MATGRVLDNDTEDHHQDLDDQDDLNLILTPDESSARKRWMTIEPLVFLLFFAVNLSCRSNPAINTTVHLICSHSIPASIYTNNLLYQICVFDLHEDRDVCRYLGTSNESETIKTLEVEAQKYSADILMWTSIFSNVVPALWSFFLCPWSDRFGRKPIFISSLVGFTLQYLIVTVITYMARTMDVNPWWYLLSTAPLILSGGYCSMITVLFCYISDITDNTNRSVR